MHILCLSNCSTVVKPKCLTSWLISIWRQMRTQRWFQSARPIWRVIVSGLFTFFLLLKRNVDSLAPSELQRAKGASKVPLESIISALQDQQRVETPHYLTLTFVLWVKRILIMVSFLSRMQFIERYRIYFVGYICLNGIHLYICIFLYVFVSALVTLPG